MVKEKHIKKVKRYWLEKDEEENYAQYINDFKIQLLEEEILTDKEVYLFFKFAQEVDNEALFLEGQIPCNLNVSDFNPILNYIENKIDIIKLNMYIYYLNKDIDKVDFFYVAYLDYKYNFSLNAIETEFLLKASRYGDIISNYIYEKLLMKGLGKSELFKATILINTYDISYEDLSKYIINTTIGKTFLKVDEIKMIGSCIESGTIDEVLEEIYKVFNLSFTSSGKNEDGIYTSLDEVDKVIISKYKNPEKIGNFLGKLKFRVWGNNKSLICFFETNEKEYIKLHAWYRETGVYTPRDGSTNFCEAKDDTLWKHTIKKSNTNKPYWAKSEKVWDNG